MGTSITSSGAQNAQVLIETWFLSLLFWLDFLLDNCSTVNSFQTLPTSLLTFILHPPINIAAQFLTTTLNTIKYEVTKILFGQSSSFYEFGIVRVINTIVDLSIIGWRPNSDCSLLAAQYTRASTLGQTLMKREWCLLLIPFRTAARCHR